jgi:hypothetical protein
MTYAYVKKHAHHSTLRNAAMQGITPAYTKTEGCVSASLWEALLRSIALGLGRWSAPKSDSPVETAPWRTVPACRTAVEVAKCCVERTRSLVLTFQRATPKYPVE